MTAGPPPARRAPAVVPDARMSKTLHLGLCVLEVLAEHPQGLTMSELAELNAVHRTVVHRLVATLEAHALVRRDSGKRFFLGTGLVTLAEPVESDLRTLAKPVLERLADELRATAHLVVRESDRHVRALLVVEPRSAAVHVAFRTGQLDDIDRGSAGLAILAALPPVPGEREEVAVARGRGYAVSFGEVVPSLHGISSAVPHRRPHTLASIGVSTFDAADEAALGRAVAAAAAEVGRLLR